MDDPAQRATLALNEQFDAELERRVVLLEQPENQGRDYDAVAWLILLLLGVVVPIIALYWGRA